LLRKTTIEKGKYSNRYLFNGKIKYTYCNSTLKRRVVNINTDNPSNYLATFQNIEYGKEKINTQGQKVGCNNKTAHDFPEEKLLKVAYGVYVANDNSAFVFWEILAD
jgi:hypothetical protein